MNAQTNTLDYQECMQNAALAFLERHQAEHLSGLSALLNRAINHLVNSFDVADSVATKLASLAHVDALNNRRRRVVVGVASLVRHNQTKTVMKGKIRFSWLLVIGICHEYRDFSGYVQVL